MSWMLSFCLPGAEPLVGEASEGGGPDGPIRVPFGRKRTATFEAKAAGLSSRAKVGGVTSQGGPASTRQQEPPWRGVVAVL